MMNINNLLKNFGVMLGGCLVALLVLEVLLRVYNPLEIRFRPDRIVLPVHKRYVIDNTGKFPTKLPPATVHTKNSPGLPGPGASRRFPGLSDHRHHRRQHYRVFLPFRWPHLAGPPFSQAVHRV